MLLNFWLLCWDVRCPWLIRDTGRVDSVLGGLVLLGTKVIVCSRLHLKFIRMVCRPVLQHGTSNIIFMHFRRRRLFFIYRSSDTLRRMAPYIKICTSLIIRWVRKFGYLSSVPPLAWQCSGDPFRC